MASQAITYAHTKAVDGKKALPSYNMYKIGDTVYKVTSIFSEKGTLKEIYEKFVVNYQKAPQKPDI